jgi:transcriptional regulator GlxA family with amidase domain
VRVSASRKSEGEWGEMAQKARYSATELARLCNLSNRQLQREFHRQLGQSPQHWLDEQRLRAAKNLLLSGQLVKQVAAQLGFRQTSHFCRQFKLQNHMTPSEFINTSCAALPSCRSQITNVADR